jgi:hypothetical protein
MRFAKGDIVRIKSLPEMLQQLDEGRAMTGKEDGRLSFPKDMEVYCGMYCTISRAFHNPDGFERYYIDADGRKWYWSVNMFEEDYSQEDVDVQYSIDILFDAME